MSETGRIVRGRVIGEVRAGDEVEVELLDLAQVGASGSGFRVWASAEVPPADRCRELQGEGEVRCDGKALHRARWHWHIDTDTGEAVMWMDRAQQQAERELDAVRAGRLS